MVVAVVVATGISVAVNSSKPAQAFTYARNAWWVNEPLGATLRITPSGLAQVEGLSAASGVMSNALTIAGTPAYGNAVYKSLLEQLQCHLLVRLKTPYDLDTWRPSVSFASEVRDKCNPLPIAASPSVTSPPATSPPVTSPPATSPPATSPPMASPSGTSLTVDATAAFGTCSALDNPPYCGGDAHSQPDPNFVASRGVDQHQGTETTGLCWQYGGNVEAPASGDNSTVWIETTLSPDPWMNVLYFPPGAADGLNQC